MHTARMPFDATAWHDRRAPRLRRLGGDVRLLFRRTAQEFLDDHCTQLAAGIAYYVLFSIFPLAILLVSISGLLLTDDRLRADVVDEIFRSLPLSEGEGRDDLAPRAVASRRRCGLGAKKKGPTRGTARRTLR